MYPLRALFLRRPHYVGGKMMTVHSEKADTKKRRKYKDKEKVNPGGRKKEEGDGAEEA